MTARDASSRLVLAADLAGTFVFGLQGALAGIGATLDLFGVLVLSFTVALGGGIIRDLMLGALPPPALRDWRYPVVALAAGGLAFALYPVVRQIPGPVLIGLDAAGLALFAVAGTEKALARGINPLGAALLGVVTGCCGGVLRDLFLARVPLILRVDIYATAALLGAVVLIVARRFGRSARTAAILGAVACFALRVVAVWQDWQLPKLAP